MKDNQNQIDNIIRQKDWKFLIKHFLPKTIVDYLSYTQGMHLVGNLAIAAADELERDNYIADLMRDFSVNLMIALREKHPQEWKKDWKNEAYLGISCALIYREEEAFNYIKNAYEKLNDLSQSLIFAYISAGRSSDHFLTDKEIIELTQNAIKKGITYEAALRMASLANIEKDSKKCEYWEQKALEAEENKVHTPLITPNILKEMFKTEDGYQHEK